MGSSGVTSTVGAVLGSFVFFLVAPGSIAGLVPYLLSRWRIQPPLLGVPAGRIVGGIVLAIGVVDWWSVSAGSRSRGMALRCRSLRLRIWWCGPLSARS